MLVVIECEIPDKYVDSFLSMLKMIETLGKNGTSAPVAFFVDGDGDCKIKFKFDRQFNQEQSLTFESINKMKDENLKLNDLSFMYNACDTLILF